MVAQEILTLNQRYDVLDYEELDNDTCKTILSSAYKKLSEREKEVLKLLTLGYSNTEIASKLFISSHTAKAHVCSILNKFQVKNRALTCYLAGKFSVV